MQSLLINLCALISFRLPLVCSTDSTVHHPSPDLNPVSNLYYLNPKCIYDPSSDAASDPNPEPNSGHVPHHNADPSSDPKPHHNAQLKLKLEVEMLICSPSHTPTESPREMKLVSNWKRTLINTHEDNAHNADTMRPAVECEAWGNANNDDSSWTEAVNNDFKPPKFSCIAIKSVDGGYYTAEKMTKAGPTGTMVQITPGSHTFVKIAFEDYLRIGQSSHTFGSASGNTGP